jgi:hypothetical protein
MRIFQVLFDSLSIYGCSYAKVYQGYIAIIKLSAQVNAAKAKKYNISFVKLIV